MDHKTDQAVELLKTLAHPLRMRIVLLLTQEPSINVSTLQSQLKVDQTLLSQHLIKMKDRGLLTSVRQGQQVYYSLPDSGISEVIKILLAIES